LVDIGVTDPGEQDVHGNVVGTQFAALEIIGYELRVGGVRDVATGVHDGSLRDIGQVDHPHDSPAPLFYESADVMYVREESRECRL
jgi:hypothetical protein